MSDDVQAAAERLRRLYNANDSYAEVYGVEQTGAGLQQRDEQAVVAAYLALHDPTPLDETWLRAVGFVAVESDMGPRYHDHYELGKLNLWEFNDTGEWLVNGADWMGLRTRGALRMLCAALGIDLREPGGER
jgi:hypothetical protein